MLRFTYTKSRDHDWEHPATDWEGTLAEWQDFWWKTTADGGMWAHFETMMSENEIVTVPFDGIEAEFGEGDFPTWPVREITEEDVRRHWNRLADSWPSPVGVRPIWELLA